MSLRLTSGQILLTHVTELDRTFWTHCSSSDPLFNLVNTPAFFGLLQACVWAAAAVCPSVRPPSAIRPTGKKRKGLLLIINRCCVMLRWIKIIKQSCSKPFKERDQSASPCIQPTACYIPPASTAAPPATHFHRGICMHTLKQCFEDFTFTWTKKKITLVLETISYILVVEFILGHAGSEKLLLHLQYRCLLSAQPLLLGVLHIHKTTESQHL